MKSLTVPTIRAVTDSPPRYGGAAVFLVRDSDRYVFVAEQTTDRESVNVELDYKFGRADWPYSKDRPLQCLGCNGSHYKVFRTQRECETAGYEVLSLAIYVFDNWADYRKAHLAPA